MRVELTVLSKAVAAGAVLLFIFAYLFQSVLVAAAGSAVLLYLSYRRLEFAAQMGRMELKAERSVLDVVVHKGSPMTVRLALRALEPVHIRIKDRIPHHFRPDKGSLDIEGAVAPDHPLSAVYTAVPEDRGRFRFPGLEVSITDPKGLFTFRTSIDPGTDVFVRASKREIVMAALMSKRKRFEVTGPAHRRHTRTHRADFRTVRDYMAGDRFRDIDWKATSRLTKLMTKEFEQETNLPTVLLMDVTLGMRELVGKVSKIDHAVALGLQLAMVLDSFSHPVGMVSFDETRVLEHLSPGKHDLDAVLLSLYRLPNPVETGGYPGSGPGPAQVPLDQGRGMLGTVGPFLVKGKRASYGRLSTTGIFEAVRSLELEEESGMLVVLISDLETNQPSIIKAIKLAIHKKHRIIVISPFSWSYHLTPGNLTEGHLEQAYMDHAAKQSILGSLKAAGVRVMDIDPKERGERVVENLRRMSQ
ncbi:MAG: DUF58 domain-containing protein [Candidatus Thermoplasmatota archaeon]|jgi:uncharacterized protein (DUF58 family)|nr:DUF58 domain-containing protein [Candidatus Thermoplasmatota archaeon]